MKFKSFLKKATACAAAMGCLLLDVTAYADSDTFNPMYSGKLSFTQKVYMTVSKDNAVLTKVIYPISGTTNRFVTIDSPDKLIFDASQLYIGYDHKGLITDIDGAIYGYTPNNVAVETYDVKIEYKGFWAKVYKVTFNGCEYVS